MKKLLIATLLFFLPSAAFAQVVTQLPLFVAPRAVLDLGNGPLEIQAVLGNGGVFTSQGNAIGSVSAGTALVLTATPTTPPIVGGFITCNTSTNCTIPANTTVTAYNGTTGVTLSASSTVTAAQVNYGAACPVSTQANQVPLPQASLVLNIGAGSGNTGATALPFYTQARLCAAGQYGPGMQLITFAIGAH